MVLYYSGFSIETEPTGDKVLMDFCHKRGSYLAHTVSPVYHFYSMTLSGQSMSLPDQFIVFPVVESKNRKRRTRWKDERSFKT